MGDIWKRIIASLFFFKDFIYLFLERGEGKEKEREKNQCVVASHTPPPGNLVHNLGMFPDGELNQLPFGLQSPSTELHQPGIIGSLNSQDMA